MIDGALCAPAVPKGSGFAFLVFSARRNDASAASLPCVFPIPQSDGRFASFFVTTQVGRLKVMMRNNVIAFRLDYLSNYEE